MADIDPRLPGTWRMSEQAPCAAGYAAHLRFEVGGLYFGSTEPAGGFTWWDQGRWQVPAAGQVALSTANDEVVTYAYSLIDGTLTFTDPSGCSFSYKRSS